MNPILFYVVYSAHAIESAFWLMVLLAWKNINRLIIPLGIAMRLVGLTASALWYDEAWSLYLARLPLFEMVRVAAMDFSPPLWELTVWPFIRMFSPELGLRLPALVFSLASLWLAWRLTHQLGFNTNERFIGMTLVAMLPYQWYLAQDGRMYAMQSALYLAAILFAIRGRALGLTATCGLLLYMHSTSIFYVASALAVAVVQHRQQWRVCLASGVLAVAATIPWWPAYMNASTKHHWLTELTPALLNAALYRVFFVDALPWLLPAYGLVVIAFSVVSAAFVSIHRMRMTLAPAILALAATGPLVLMVAVSPAKNLLFYRPLSALTIPLALWIGMALPSLWRPLRYSITVQWLALIIIGLFTWSPASKGAELRTIAARLAGCDCVIYHATATSLLPFSVVLPDENHILLDDRQHDGLLSDDLRDVFGLQRQTLERIALRPVYVVWARDDLMSDDADRRMLDYTRNGVLIGSVHYWQAATIEVYLLP